MKKNKEWKKATEKKREKYSHSWGNEKEREKYKSDTMETFDEKNALESKGMQWQWQNEKRREEKESEVSACSVSSKLNSSLNLH